MDRDVSSGSDRDTAWDGSVHAIAEATMRDHGVGVLLAGSVRCGGNGRDGSGVQCAVTVWGFLDVKKSFALFI